MTRAATADSAMRQRLLIVAMGALLAALALASLALGPAAISPWTAARALVEDLGSASVIVREIRLPRTLLALLIGWIFGLTGAALQGLLRNPLADTAVFGAPQAAALGAVLVLYFGLVGALSWALPVAAIAGRAALDRARGRGGGPHATIVVLVLAGLAVGSLAGAATSLAISLSPNPFAVTEIVFWLLGSLEDRSMRACGAGDALHSRRERPASRRGARACARWRSARRRRAASASASPGCGWSSSWRRPSAPAPPWRWRAPSASSGSWRPISYGPFVGYDPARTLVPAGLAGRRFCWRPIAPCASSRPPPRSRSAS